MIEAAARPALPPEIAPFLEDLAAGRPPSAPGGPAALAGAVRVHGLTGTAAAAVDAGLPLPPDVRTEILVDRAALRRQRTVLDLELERIARRSAAARAAGAPLSEPIVIKGPAVAARYRDPDLRFYGDLDLLVPAAERDRWIGLLAGAGYEPPPAWQRRRSARYHHETRLVRRSAGVDLICEIHTSMWVERRARRFDHAALAPLCEPAGPPGVLRPRPDALLVILALHLLHHRREDRRLIWIRDLVEIGTPTTVAGARGIARAAGVDWALERALAEAERVLRERRWDARPPAPDRFGLARAADLEGSGHLYHLAMMRELGPAGAVRYLATLLDPRRFRGPDGRFDRAALRAWSERVLATARRTAWTAPARRWLR